MKKQFNLFCLAIVLGSILDGCARKLETGEVTSTNTTTAVAAAQVASLINNDAVWRDTDGNEIDAQGGCVVKFADTFHWFGAEFRPEPFTAVNHYTSTDLVTWVKKPAAIRPGMPGIPFSDGHWVGRPWVMWNPNTNRYVMVVEWGAGGGYRVRYAFLTSNSLYGPWTYQSSKTILQLPDVNNDKWNLGDLGVYVEGNNAWLLYTFDKPQTNYSQAILKLDADFMTPMPPTPGNYVEFTGGTYRAGVQEAAAVFKRGSAYYYFTSVCASWNSSETRYRTATSMAGPWTNNAIVPTNPYEDSSYNTQHDFVLPVVGSNTTTYIYCGDRWSNKTGKGIGRYAWFPLTFDANGVPTMNAPGLTTNGGDWILHVATGEWTTPTSNLVQNPGFENNFTNWTYTGNASIATDAAEIHTGTKAVKSWSTSAYVTTINNATANCAAGTYSATVWSRAGGTFNQRVFQVFVNGTKTQEITLPIATTWTAYTINNISVPTGATVSVAISLNANARAWTQFDDFSLTRN
jgi:hypothetical protein